MRRWQWREAGRVRWHRRWRRRRRGRQRRLGSGLADHLVACLKVAAGTAVEMEPAVASPVRAESQEASLGSVGAPESTVACKIVDMCDRVSGVAEADRRISAVLPAGGQRLIPSGAGSRPAGHVCHYDVGPRQLRRWRGRRGHRRWRRRWRRRRRRGRQRRLGSGLADHLVACLKVAAGTAVEMEPAVASPVRAESQEASLGSVGAPESTVACKIVDMCDRVSGVAEADRRISAVLPAGGQRLIPSGAGSRPAGHVCHYDVGPRQLWRWRGRRCHGSPASRDQSRGTPAPAQR